MANPFYTIGPQKTPKFIQIFIILIATMSFLCALQITFFPDLPLQYLFTLSWLGFKEHLLWQPLTYLFLIPSEGISISFFLNLAFHLYLFWIFATSLFERCGRWKFLILFFGSGLSSAFFALLVLSSNYPFYMLAGNTIVLYAILIAWVMLNPNAQLRLFFAIPFSAKWLIFGFLGFTLLLALSDWDFVTFVSYFTGALFGYIFTLCLYHVHSPLPFLHKMERQIIAFLRQRKEKK